MDKASKHERVSKLFLEASELRGDERDAFLIRACGDDTELRAEVEAMLVGRENVPEILRTGVIPFRVRDEEQERPPHRIGEFKVSDKLGEGGMGIVYRAEQERPIRRAVAIKLIKRAFETERVLARFEAEGQALALMNHPNVAHVLDVGVTGHGRPYIAMEFVDGEPITLYCDRRQLGIHQRLELFLEVCDAVQHAHQKAIIHRDIKPSNILVTTAAGKAVPKVIDFGVAKVARHDLAEDKLRTEIGQLIGTPEYMSPEQAEMNDTAVDTRTDVYSLGVLLYELLVGVQPFDPEKFRSGGLDQIRRRIREVEPPSPSVRLTGLRTVEEVARNRSGDVRSLTRQVRGELDWIVLRAMEKEPTRRYASPHELAADVQRLLVNEPIAAGPPGRVYRMRKMVRRHRVGVGFASVLGILLIAVALTTTLQARRISRERNRADAAARQSMQKALAAREVSEFLVRVFDFSEDREAARRQLDGALAKVQRDYAGQPSRRARLTYPLGQIYNRLGFEDGVPLMVASMELLRDSLGVSDPEVLAAMHTRATQLADAGRLDDSVALLDEVLERRHESLGHEHPDTLGATIHLARVHEMRGDYEQAERLLFGALATGRRVFGEEHPLTLRSMGYVANLRLRQDRIDEADRLFREVLDRMERTIGVENGATLACLYKLGCIAARMGNDEEALALIRRAVDAGWEYSWTHGGKLPNRVALQSDPDLASLRGHPGFEALVAEDGYVAALDAARISAWDRDFDEALRQLTLAVERGFSNGTALLRDDRLIPLHGHEEFQRIVAELQQRRSSGRPGADL